MNAPVVPRLSRFEARSDTRRRAVVRFPAAAVCVIALALVLRIMGGSFATAAYVILGGYAFLGRVQTIHALALSWVFTMLNTGLVAGGDPSGVARHFVTVCAAASMCIQSLVVRGVWERSRKRELAVVMILGAGILLHSVILSSIPSVSVLKGLSWLLTTFALVVAWTGMPRSIAERVGAQVMSGLILVAVTSIPLLGLEVGYLRNGRGFQGVLGHPQAFGPTMAVLGAWLLSSALAGERVVMLRLGLLSVVVPLIVASQARTAGVAFAVGVSLALGVYFVLRRAHVYQDMPALRRAGIRAVVFVVVVAALLTAPRLSEEIAVFLRKDSSTGTFLEAYDASRGRLFDRMVWNIEQAPFTGIGFGIASDPADLLIVRDSTTGLPLGAAVEKGVLPLAVLEELGVVGFVLFFAWIVVVVTGSYRSGIVALTVVCTSLITNFAEATLMSPGGMGLLYLVVITWATSGAARNAA